VEFPVGEDWWPFARDIWANKNYDLIHSDMRKYIGQVNDLTERAITSGWSVPQLQKQIQGLDEHITKARAEFIARDQMGKLNGEITQRRMESVGLTMYIWETSGDERVRPSHKLMDDKLCRWDDPTVCSEDGGKTWIDRPSGAVQLHPGMDYQCRCTATSYWEELVQEADKLLDYEGPGTVEGETKRGLEYYKAQEKRRAAEAAQKRAKKAAFSSKQKASEDYIRKVYPDEKFITQSAKLQVASKYAKGLVIPKNVMVAASRIPINVQQREVLRKELHQAEILAMLGSFVYLIPELGPYGVKLKDAVVDGDLFEFRTITGNAKTLEWEFGDAKKKGKDVNNFLNIESDIPKNEVRRRIALVLRRHPEYTGKITVSLRDGKTYFWDSSSFR
jgi:SPP1 gp7 family putative phage head morphogenesis protein